MSSSSIVEKNNNMGSTTPFFHEFKKQASFFLKEKIIKTARLALTDVTPAELLTEEAMNGNPWAPDTRSMGLISKAAFEVDDYWRIVEILHKRFERFDRKNWRVSYKALILLEHLLTHGPESFAEEFQSDRPVIQVMKSFQYVDERGFDWGLNVKRKSERVLKLLEKGPLLKEERNRARKLTRGIQGFGSLSQKSVAGSGSFGGSQNGKFERCMSDYISHENHGTGISNAQGGCGSNATTKFEFRTSSKENMMPTNELLPVEFHKKTCMKESKKPLVVCENTELLLKNEVSVDEEDHHPFNYQEHQSTASLLSARNGFVQES